MLKFDTTIHHLEYLNMMYLLVPKTVLEQVEGGLKQRLLCSINQGKAFNCGLVSLGNGDAYIGLNATLRKNNKLELGDVVNITIEADTSEYGMQMSEELKEVLAQIPDADRRFHALTKGKQRYIIHYVNGVKSSQKKIERSLLLINNLVKLPEGKEGFDGLLRK